MPAFAINAIDRAGVRRFLREDASSEATLRVQLRAQSLWPVRIREVRADRKLARLTLPAPEFVGLLHQLELQLRAGVNADSALGQLAADAPPGAMRFMLEKIHREVAQGTPIHVACRFFEKQFPPHLAAVVSAGEASAQLPESIRALAAHVSGNAELRRTARRALIYPVVVLIATTALIGFLLGGVVPQFAAIFASLHLPLPAVTVALIGASEFVRHGWPALIAGSVGAVALAGVMARSPRGRLLRDAALLHLPVLGEVVRHLATARFAAHCRLLHEAGIPLLDALRTGAELTGNAVMARQLEAARARVAVGQPLYAALPKRHAFPGFIVPALKSGETTGQLGAALRHIEDYAASRARERLATALALLEPALLAALTGIVGLIALSFFLPLFSLLGGVSAR
jgi:type II secretory pathway component PulF